MPHSDRPKVTNTCAPQMEYQSLKCGIESSLLYNSAHNIGHSVMASVMPCLTIYRLDEGVGSKQAHPTYSPCKRKT